MFTLDDIDALRGAPVETPHGALEDMSAWIERLWRGVEPLPRDLSHLIHEDNEVRFKADARAWLTNK